MKKITLLSFIILSIFAAAEVAAQARITVTGGNHTPVSLSPERTSGLEALFVVDTSAGSAISAAYTPSTPGAPVSWSRFANLGGAMAEDIPDATGYTLDNLRPDMGYIVTEGNRRYCFWITDYASSPFSVESVAVTESDCSTVTLHAVGTGSRMTYFSINGRAIEIDREIKVEYTTLTYDKGTASYVTHHTAADFPYLRDELHLPAPLTDTRFLISGDRFLREWGLTAEAESDMMTATAVEATVSAVRADREEADNEQRPEGADGLGGSAPVDIEFVASVTDAALFTEWQFAADPDFTTVDLRFSDQVMTYSFRESGTTYIRFVAANASGSCEYISETFEVNIGESDIKCPNAFSPSTSEGVNDEWRVSYKSIVEFECHIFSRSGRQVAHFTDPAKGWDGRIDGKFAKPGVYYYVIKATGSDGRHYNLSGDINIVGYH